MILKVDKGLVQTVIKKAIAGAVSVKDALKEIFPKTFSAMDRPFPKLMVKRLNAKTGESINRVVLFSSPKEGRVVFAGTGKYPVGHSGTDIKVEYYEDIDEVSVAKIMLAK